MNYKKEAQPAASTKVQLPVFKILVIGVVVAAVLFGGFIFYSAFDNGETGVVTLEFSKPEQVAVGEPFSVAVSISNVSDKILKDARLTLSLPDKVSFLGANASRRIVEQAIGDLGPGRLLQENFNLVVLGDPQSLKRLEAKLLYSIPGSRAQFEEPANLDIAVGDPAIEVELKIPENVVSGEEFEIVISYRNTTEQAFKDMRVQAELPPIFKLTGSSVPSIGKEAEWKVEDLEKGEEGELILKGMATGPEQTFFGFNIRLLADFFGSHYAVGEEAGNLAIATSPLSVEISVNGNKDYIAHIGESLKYAVTFRNNSEVPLSNLTVRAELLGDLFDFITLNSKGAFNSLQNTIQWTVANTPELAFLSPGEEKRVEFDVGLKSEFPIRRLGDKNFTLKTRALVESPTVPQGVSASKTSSLATHESKVGGALTIDAQAYFFDAAAGVLNTGPYPPRVNQPTQYTVHWVVKTEAADFSNIQLTSFVQSGGKWTGSVKSNIDTAPVYDATTGRVSWAITGLAANKGRIASPAEAIFQIELTPAVNQIGLHIPILSDTSIQGTDVWIGRTVFGSDTMITTELLDDTNVGTNDRAVQP